MEINVGEKKMICSSESYELLSSLRIYIDPSNYCKTLINGNPVRVHRFLMNAKKKVILLII